MNLSEFLNLRHLPARLEAWQVAACLGFDGAHIPILITARLLRPLGSPPLNAPKYFSRAQIVSLADDERWLARASDALVAHWATRNGKKTKSKKSPKY